MTATFCHRKKSLILWVLLIYLLIQMPVYRTTHEEGITKYILSSPCYSNEKEVISCIRSIYAIVVLRPVLSVTCSESLSCAKEFTPTSYFLFCQIQSIWSFVDGGWLYFNECTIFFVCFLATGIKKLFSVKYKFWLNHGLSEKQTPTSDMFEPLSFLGSWQNIESRTRSCWRRTINVFPHFGHWVS